MPKANLKAPKATAKITAWNGSAVLKSYQGRIVFGIAAASQDVARFAQGRAPAGTRAMYGKSERLQLNATPTGKLKQELAGAREGTQESARIVGRFFADLQSRGVDINKYRSGFTTFKGGETPGRLVIERGFVRGQRTQVHLRDSIRALPPQLDGNVVSSQVVATAKHAAPIEYGFQHKGGWKKKSGKTTQVNARPFMRPAIAEISEPFRTGKYFQG